MSSKALITTQKDLSGDIFERHGWEIVRYGTTSDKNYDIVYLRDPFNDGSVSRDDVERSVSGLRYEKSIDGVMTYEQMLSLEDKYNQWQIFRDFMPVTFLPSEHEFVPGKYLAKKRVSQRAKDILFDIAGVAGIDDNWIFQEIMDISEELRVYIVGDEVIPHATVKSSKISGKVKVIGKRELTAKEMDFCRGIKERLSLDFVGLDLAVLDSGELRLIEANRSPQFKRFVEMYGEATLSGILDI